MNGWTIVLSVILLPVAAVIVVDLLPLLWRWVSRIHIGRWDCNKEWQAASEKVLLGQLKKPPCVPLSDQTRLTFIERIKGEYSNATLGQWQQASLLLGAKGLCESEKAQRGIEQFIAAQIGSDGDWRKFEPVPETAMLAFAILSSHPAGKEKYKPAMDRTAEMLFDLAEKFETVPYNRRIPEMRFVDTVGMICPFLTKYAFEYDCPRALMLAKKHIDEYAALGLHEKFPIPVHCFNRVSGAPLGVYGWGRGCGWWAYGLMDTYLSLTHSGMPCEGAILQSTATAALLDEFNVSLVQKMTDFAKTLVVFQMENGAWDRQVFLMGSGESSATAMLAWFMKKMYEISAEESFAQSHKKAMDYLSSATRRNGMVDFAQGDTKGIGFYCAKLDAMPAAQGFTVRCFSKQG